MDRPNFGLKGVLGRIETDLLIIIGVVGGTGVFIIAHRRAATTRHVDPTIGLAR